MNFHIVPNKCAKCKRKLNNNVKTIRGKEYHSECLVCFHCNNPLVGEFIEHDGNYYCENDYRKLFLKNEGNCVKCQNMIQKAATKDSKGNLYHLECFSCGLCGSSLSVEYMWLDSTLACMKCFKNSAEQKKDIANENGCKQCNKSINKEEKFVEEDGFYFHPMCYNKWLRSQMSAK